MLNTLALTTTAALAPAQARQAPNPLAVIPQALIANGSRTREAFVGPNWLMSKSQGNVTVTRNANGITIAHPQHGNLSITPRPNGQVRVSLPDGTTYDGRLSALQGGGVRFTANGGQRVDIRPNGNRVDISMSGFGAVVDRMGVYLR
jgi:hypothetical protein